MNLTYFIPFLMLFLPVLVFANSPTKPTEILRIAVYIDTPYAYYDNNILVGSNIDFAKALATKLNKKIDFLVCPIARCLALIKNGQADLLIDINKTAERQTYLNYLPPYREQLAPLHFFTRKKDTISIESYHDLFTLSIGVIRGTSFSEQLQQNKAIKIVPLNTQRQLIKMLHFGRIDAFMGREESLIGLVDYQQYRDEFSISTWQYSQHTPSYFAISKRSPLNDDIAFITEILNQLKRDGTIERIFQTKKMPE